MQVDELYNPLPGETEQQARAAYLQKVKILQREEFLLKQGNRSVIKGINIQKQKNEENQNNDNHIIAERFARQPNMSPDRNVKKKERRNVRYIFEGEDEDYYRLKDGAEKDILQSEIDKKE